MEYKEIKKNMTQWPWVIFSDKGKTKAFLPAMRPGTVCEVEGLSEADTQAIWQAMDGTYGKGINPEAVGELRDAVDGTKLMIQFYLDKELKNYQSNWLELLDRLNKALAHARGEESK